jgi:hypothetical protein
MKTLNDVNKSVKDSVGESVGVSVWSSVGDYVYKKTKELKLEKD